MGLAGGSAASSNGPACTFCLCGGHNCRCGSLAVLVAPKKPRSFLALLFGCFFAPPEAPVCHSNPLPPAPPPLPPPDEWELLGDVYRHRVTGDSVRASAGRPPWALVVDGDGDRFFRNTATGELAWALPAAPAELPRSVHLHYAVLDARARSLRAEEAAARSRARAVAAGASAVGSVARAVAAAHQGLAALRAAAALQGHAPRRAVALIAAPPAPAAQPSPRAAALLAELEVARAHVRDADERVAVLFGRGAEPPIKT